MLIIVIGIITVGNWCDGWAIEYCYVHNCPTGISADGCPYCTCRKYPFEFLLLHHFSVSTCFAMYKPKVCTV